jgi:hypothetical protein
MRCPSAPALPQAGMRLLFRKYWHDTAHQGDLRAEYEALLIRLLAGTWAAGAWWGLPGQLNSF